MMETGENHHRHVLVVDGEPRVHRLKHLLTVVSGLHGNAEDVNQLLQYVLFQICDYLHVSSAVLVDVPDGSDPQIRLRAGELADIDLTRSLLDKNQIQQEAGLSGVADGPFRLIQSCGLAVVLESQAELTPENSRLIGLFLQHASHAIRSADQQALRPEDEQLVALGRTIGLFAHDLRGPLGTMRQVIDVLRDGKEIGMTPEELYEMLDKSVRSTNQLIDDCLEYVRGNPKVSIVQGTWAQLLRGPIDSLKRELELLGAEFVLDVDRSCSMHVDPEQVARVVGNFCKYAAQAVKRQPGARVIVGARSDDKATHL